MPNEPPSYRTLSGSALSELLIERSRFWGLVAPCDSEEAARALIAAQRKAYPGTRHTCSAFIVDPAQRLSRSSDDGEPAGTAGRPMLAVLEGAGLVNVCACVSRYFGGILLGTGGLVRAYSGAVAAALKEADLIERHWAWDQALTVPYSLWGGLQNLFSKEAGLYHGVQADYADRVRLRFDVTAPDFPRAKKLLEDALQQAVHLTKTFGRYIDVPTV